MRIAIYGATGTTGKLIAAELATRGVETRLIGRDSNALKNLASEKTTASESAMPGMNG